MPGGPESNTTAFSGAGEAAFVDWVRHRQARQIRDMGLSYVQASAGDDLAVLEWPGGLVLMGVDPVLDGVHMDLAVHGPGAAGRKAMNRNLSDVAAMGGVPVAATLSIVAPKTLYMQELQQAYEGAEAAGAAAGCPIVGGDFASWTGPLVLTVGILARSSGRVVRRQGAVAGDTIFVSGPLGGSILGRHLNFLPRLALGKHIADVFRASAMIDVSDGLSRDLPRLLEGGLGAQIAAGQIPIHEDARRLAMQTGRDPLWHALHDGEDYELLFTAATQDLPGCTAIGTVEAARGIRLLRDAGVEALLPQGWEHRLER